jgi:ABC-type molybdate transport system permease subunit
MGSMVEPHEIERYKSVFEYLKHLVSLSTGSIVILATFLEKIVKSQEWKIFRILALLGFLFTVICSTVAYSLLIFDFPGRKTKTKEWENAVGGFALIFSWIGFVIGIISVSVYTIKNII